MPLALAISGLIAWRLSRRKRGDSAVPPAWRDDSLDEWRREQAELQEQERTGLVVLQRSLEESQQAVEGAPEERRQSRIGG